MLLYWQCDISTQLRANLLVYSRSLRYLNNIFLIDRIRASAWITEMMMMMIIMMFLLSTLAYPIGILYDYKINLLFLLPAEVSKIFIIIQIKAGSLEKVTSNSTFLVQLHWLHQDASIFRIRDRPVNPVFLINIAIFFAFSTFVKMCLRCTLCPSFYLFLIIPSTTLLPTVFVDLYCINGSSKEYT